MIVSLAVGNHPRTQDSAYGLLRPLILKGSKCRVQGLIGVLAVRNIMGQLP